MRPPSRAWFGGIVLAAVLLTAAFILFRDKDMPGVHKRPIPDGYLVMACKTGNDAYFALAEADFNSYGPEQFRKTNTPYSADDIDGIAAIINDLPHGPQLGRIVALAIEPMASGDMTIRRLTDDEYRRLKKLLVDMGRSDVKVSGLKWADDEESKQGK